MWARSWCVAGFRDFSANKVTVATVAHLKLDARAGEEGDACIKAGFVRGGERWVVKVASGWPQNRANFGTSNSQGAMLVFSQRHGALEAVLADGGCLTDLRTVVAAAICVQNFAPVPASGALASVCIVGPGVIAALLCKWLPRLVDAVSMQRTELNVLGRSMERAQEFAAVCHAEGWQSVTAATLADAACFERADVIITCTPALQPVLLRRRQRPSLNGAQLVVALGADSAGKRELGPMVFLDTASADAASQRPIVIADSRMQCLAFGECASAVSEGLLRPEDVCELGSTLALDSSLRPRAGCAVAEGRDIVVDLTGVAVQDVVIASLVVEAAIC